MKSISLKSLFALTLLGLTALVASSCGNDVPPGAVAKVGDSEITQDEFDQWLETAVKGQAQGGTAAVPDPPELHQVRGGQEEGARARRARRSRPTPSSRSSASRSTTSSRARSCSS